MLGVPEWTRTGGHFSPPSCSSSPTFLPAQTSPPSKRPSAHTFLDGTNPASRPGWQPPHRSWQRCKTLTRRSCGASPSTCGSAGPPCRCGVAEEDGRMCRRSPAGRRRAVTRLGSALVHGRNRLYPDEHDHRQPSGGIARRGPFQHPAQPAPRSASIGRACDRPVDQHFQAAEGEHGQAEIESFRIERAAY